MSSLGAVYREELDELRQALADVRTLDDWALHGGVSAYWLVSSYDEESWIVTLFVPDSPPEHSVTGATPDEARAKAAAWARSQKCPRPTDIIIDDWVCRLAPYGRSASHPDGTGFSCDQKNGLAATCNQQRALPPAVLWWLVQPIVEDNDRHY